MNETQKKLLVLFLIFGEVVALAIIGTYYPAYTELMLVILVTSPSFIFGIWVIYNEFTSKTQKNKPNNEGK